MGTFMSNTATAALLIPMAMALPGAGSRELTMLAGLACSFGMALPVSTPPNLLAYSTGIVNSREMLRSGAVLALAGAPVRARRMRLSPFALGASIRVTDNLQEGESRFYAEITRLRQLNELALRKPSLLFLLDEVLQGTNSRDRFVGAQGVIRALIDRGAVGLVTTHDLALTSIDMGGPERAVPLLQDALRRWRAQVGSGPIRPHRPLTPARP